MEFSCDAVCFPGFAGNLHKVDRNTRKRGETGYVSLSEMKKELCAPYVAMRRDSWNRMINREMEGLIDPESSKDWHLYFREWTRRYVSRELWEQQ